jgi:hypothetical protein
MVFLTETACFSKTLAFTIQSTWRFNSKEHQNCHHHAKLKSHTGPAMLGIQVWALKVSGTMEEQL